MSFTLINLINLINLKNLKNLKNLINLKNLKNFVSLLVLLLWLPCWAAVGNDNVDSLIMELDNVIAQRPKYMQEKEKTISKLWVRHQNSRGVKDRFNTLADILEQYRYYNSDSAMNIAEQRMVIAYASEDPELIVHASLSMAEIYCVMGQYAEAMQLLRQINYNQVPDFLKGYYFHVNRTLYGLLIDYSVRQVDKDKYNTITDHYRDSLLTVNDPSSIVYAIIRCDQYNAHNEPQKGIDVINTFSRNKLTKHEIAIAAYTLSESYGLLGDTINQKRYLIISAIEDMKTAVREYVSLRKLALMLYRDGDVEHAYEYLEICLDDAMKCNARLRLLEVNEILTVVSRVHHDTVRRQQYGLKWGILAMAVLLLGVLGMLVYARRAQRKVDVAHQQVKAINEQLKALNDDMRHNNEQLQIANREIAENSLLKETYITHYMDQCSIYIEKLEKYRNSLGKIVKSGKIDDLKKLTAQLTQLDNLIKDFYTSFDITFLRLYPTFVDDFNALLQPGERFVLKTPGQLNTELRIFALIRLGVTDSAKIAQFLRYSLATIYNYRTRVRNKALGNRDDLESQVMQIGKF